ncbi:MAG: hypothetical protein EHM28_10510, partial [Spirochaetaceae bacterium]
MNLSFFMNRISHMSPGEIFFRLRRHAVTWARKIIYSHHTPVVKLTDKNRRDQFPRITIPQAGIRRELLLCKANLLCLGKLGIFAMKEIDISGGIDWHRDYSTGIRAPSNLFSMDIDYRDRCTVGDSKYIWEPNRHLFLVTLARAWAETHEDKYIEVFKKHLVSWMDCNPFMHGINWSSALETGIRLIRWSVAWHFAASALSAKIKARWLESIYLHCLVISKNFSRYSSANNHLIGEATGLFSACCLLPPFKQTNQWRKISRSIIVREMIRQNYPDGVNREQASWYGMYVLDFLLLGIACSERAGVPFPRECYKIAESMTNFFLAVRDHGDVLPEHGDRDDGMMIDLEQRESGMIDSMATSTGFFCNQPGFISSKIDAKTQVLLAIAGRDLSTGTDARTKTTGVTLPASGYYILRNMAHGHEQKLVFDAGPIGYLSIAAHGHADALAFTLSINKVPVFVDRGTGAYFSKPEWRRYFRSTQAHNTVEVDGEDQSVQAGLFMWGKKAGVKVLEYKCGDQASEKRICIRASHDGYKRLSDPVVHERSIELDMDSGTWIIIDKIICRKEHTSALFFHLNPDCNAIKQDNTVTITIPDSITQPTCGL